MNYGVMNYILYLVISIAMTVWVGRTLYRNGRIFLVDAFSGNEKLADSVNHLLIVGFYLINFGYVSLKLKSDIRPTETVELIEGLSVKIGVNLLVLGAMHFFNLFLFSRLKKKA